MTFRDLQALTQEAIRKHPVHEEDLMENLAMAAFLKQ
jgi:hypothetical protein